MRVTHSHTGKTAPRRAPAPVSRAEFEALRTRLQDVEDSLTVLQSQNDGTTADIWPAALVERLLAGETPLRLWREQRGMTLKRLSEITGIAAGYLSEVENGKKPGSASALKKCARALRVELDDLVRE